MTTFETGKVVVRMDGEAFLVKAIRVLPKITYEGFLIDIRPAFTMRRTKFAKTLICYEGFSYSIYERSGRHLEHLKSKGHKETGRPLKTREDAIEKAKIWIDNNLLQSINSHEMRFI
jgi:hypothetical protein